MKISVVIPVKNGAKVLKECLDGIFRQKIDHDLEVLVIDSGSRDATLELLQAYPVRVESIHPSDFNHGDTRNLGAALTDGEVIVFTVQDAYPRDDHWLARLTDNLFKDERTAGAYSRIIPRPECGPLVEKGVMGDLNFRDERIEMTYESPDAPEGWDRHTHRVRANYNDVSSAMKRSVWERLPYPRTPFGEDSAWADSALRAGYKIVFDPTSVMIHSHEYNPASVYPRTHIDGWYNRAFFQRLCIEKLSHVFIMTWRHFKEDRAFLKTKALSPLRKAKESVTSLAFHFMEFLGFYLGGRTGDTLQPAMAVEPEPLRILMPLSESTANDPGAVEEVRSLGQRLTEAGHHIILVRAGRSSGDQAGSSADQAGSSAGQEPEPEEWEGFPLLRLPWSGGAIEGLPIDHDEILRKHFSSLVGQEKVDLVHCMDYRPFTAAMADLCRSMNLPRLITLNDLWFWCPRGDRVLPDGRFCSARIHPGPGCRACLMGQQEFVPAAGWMGGMARLAGKGMDTLRSQSATTGDPARPAPAASTQLEGSTPAASAHLEGFTPAASTHPMRSAPAAPTYLNRAAWIQDHLGCADFVIAPNRAAKVLCTQGMARLNNVVHIGYGGNSRYMVNQKTCLEQEDRALRERFTVPECPESSERAARQLIVKYRQALSRARWAAATEESESRMDAENGERHGACSR